MTTLTRMSLWISNIIIFNLFTIIVMLGCYMWVQPAKVKPVQCAKSEWVMDEKELARFVPKQKNPLVVKWTKR